MGECGRACDFVWLDDAEGVTVWGPHWRVLEARGTTLTLVDGRTIDRAELEFVYAWAADDCVVRGVRAGRARARRFLWCATCPLSPPRTSRTRARIAESLLDRPFHQSDEILEVCARAISIDAAVRLAWRNVRADHSTA